MMCIWNLSVCLFIELVLTFNYKSNLNREKKNCKVSSISSDFIKFENEEQLEMYILNFRK